MVCEVAYHFPNEFYLYLVHFQLQSAIQMDCDCFESPSKAPAPELPKGERSLILVLRSVCKAVLQPRFLSLVTRERQLARRHSLCSGSGHFLVME